jgi:protein-S-isoprenylcysteine O-methyltransferase Ste14
VSRLELRVPPLALAVLCAIGIAALPEIVESSRLAFAGHRIVALAVFVLGVSIAAAGVVEFRRSRTTVNPLAPEQSSSMVTTGVYRWTRNPMYLGMATSLLGVAVWRATLPGYLLVPLFCTWLDRFQIRPEERILFARFGAQFSSYMSRVRRWV